ncbi:MAG: HAMP domain-containing histidine kinase [Paenibacillaceae bacterium]|nr:HAMP domain-containing histidine kinase [Paenibacillaceae bacterium]
MNFRTQIMLLSSIWLICILIVVNIAVYAMFLKVAARNETDELRLRGERIIEEIGIDSLMRPNNERLLRKYLSDHAMIRTATPAKRVINLMYNDPRLSVIAPLCDAEITAAHDKADGETIHIVRLPLRSEVDERHVGCIELAVVTPGLQRNLRALVTIMLFSTVVAALLSMLGGASLAGMLLKPINRIVGTMEAIESSFQFARIPLPSGDAKDEPYKMAATFNRMMDRIENGFHQQQQFVSDASHELKTTLTIIEGYAGMLRRWGFGNEQVAREAVDSIYEEAQRMKKMTQQLLDLAAAEKKEHPPFEKTDLAALGAQTAKVVERLVKRPIRVIAEDGPAIVTADPLKLKQVLHILLDNALKYSTAGIEMEIGKKGEWGVIRVRDSGIGIPQEQLPRVFERFYRVDPSRQRKTGGTGLGLSIARSIVLQHGGTIEIASEEGVGTEVTVRLPETQLAE